MKYWFEIDNERNVFNKAYGEHAPCASDTVILCDEATYNGDILGKRYVNGKFEDVASDKINELQARDNTKN